MTKKNSTIFCKIFAEFLLTFQQAVCGCYLNKYPAIRVPHSSEIKLLKQDLMATELTSNAAFERHLIFQSDSEFVSSYTIITLSAKL